MVDVLSLCKNEYRFLNLLNHHKKRAKIERRKMNQFGL
jgi:hypothetical protein